MDIEKSMYLIQNFWYYKEGDCYVNKFLTSPIIDIDNINKIYYIQEKDCSYFDMTDIEPKCLYCNKQLCVCNNNKYKLTIDEYHNHYCVKKNNTWIYIGF